MAAALFGCRATQTPDNPLVIQVSGNHFVDGSGHTIRLTGVNVPLGDCTVIKQNPVSAIAAWNVNAVRFAMDEDCWLGINGETAISQATFLNYITQLHQNGMYVIIDLHYVAPGTFPAKFGLPMPDSDHSVAFWSSIAAALKNDNAVIFNLYNEPNHVTWSCWKDGGCTVFDATHNVNYTAVGMQTLVNTVRAAGATTQPILLDGINFAQDLSQFLANKPTDPSNAIVAGLHEYDTFGCDTTCMSGKVNPILTAGVPVIIGELGEHDCLHGFIDTIMPWADGFSPPLSYLGWAWFVGSCTGIPSLISDYNGTPTGFGIGLKNHLAAIR